MNNTNIQTVLDIFKDNIVHEIAEYDDNNLLVFFRPNVKNERKDVIDTGIVLYNIKTKQWRSFAPTENFKKFREAKTIYLEVSD